MRISVVGGGSWGTAFASHLTGAGHDVDLLARDAEHAAEIEATRENRQYLPGVRIADGLRVGPLAAGIAPDVGLVVLAVPSRAFGAVLAALEVPASADVLSLTKGLDPATGRRLSEVAAALLGDAGRVAVLSGPNHAEEIARGTPAATVIASQPVALARRLQETVGDVAPAGLRERRRGRGRAVRRREERDRPRRRCLGRPRLRRQRQGGADHARSRGDDAARRLLRRRPAHLRRPGRSRRPGGDLLLVALAQPPGGPAAGRGGRGRATSRRGSAWSRRA